MNVKMLTIVPHLNEYLANLETLIKVKDSMENKLTCKGYIAISIRPLQE